MTTNNIIELVIILVAVLMAAGSFLPLNYRGRRRLFMVAYSQAESYINTSRRNNYFAAARAHDMIRNIKAAADSKWRRRHITQLEILWKSKFSDTFKSK